ncbi:MAG: pilus assembly protein [Cellvibrionaceae bacterium]
MRQKTSLFKSLTLAGATLASCNALAAPGILEDLPLNISTSVQPNIFFLLDDSGSMDWEVLQSSGARASIYAGNPDSGNIDLTPTPSDQTELLESCALYNVMYYDPAQTYTPWVGVDINGNPYADQIPTAAAVNPFNPALGNQNLVTQNDGALGIPGYIPFSDVNGNGLFDVGDCGDAGTVAQMYANFVSVFSMNAVQQVNFANWYSYYRKREYVAKRALSEIIEDSSSRMGMATLHNNSLDGNGVGTLIQNMQNNASKATLKANLFNVDSSNGTPLRSNLMQVGDYFREGSNSGNLFGNPRPTHAAGETLNANTPLFSATDGGSCQQNFAVVFSDGYWNTDANNLGLGNTDGDNNTIWDGTSFADTVTSRTTLADIAMEYLENDLSSTLSDDLQVDDAHQLDVEIPHQHLTTYTVAFGVNGNLTTSPNVGDASFTWPQPSANQPTTIDDMRHAAWNGRGDFLSAGNPQQLITSLSAAIDDIGDRTASASAASFTSGSITSDTLVFRSRFSTEDWTGNLLAYRFDGDGNIDFDAPIWSAGDIVPSQSSRSIITYNGVQGVPFEFPSPYSTVSSSTLSSQQVSNLLTNAPFSPATVDASETTANQTFGDDLVDFLRGDASNEVTSAGSGIFRSRNGNPLGSFIHSSPQYMGPPNEGYPNLIEGVGSEYNQFVIDRETRAPLVFVGGNDGMLHGFDGSETGGNEVFAYIPSFLVNDLHSLAETDYSHLAYVDSTPTIRDVYVDGDWRTFLVGGVRSGGRGIYALDVTDPTVLADQGNASSIVEFEFVGDASLDVDTNPAAGGDADLGFTYSRPQIAKMNDGSWVAIIANGYNSEGDGTAKLFIVDLETGEARELDTGEGSIVNSSCADINSDCNGLSSPTIADLNGDFRVDRIYAGDLHGNMWVFNVADTDPSNWGVAFGGEPLFRACTASPCTTANRQPITVRPEITTHPARRSFSTSPNVLVYFGTGQFVAQGDDSDTTTQSFYAVWDAGSTSTSSLYGDLDRSDLQGQSFTNTSGLIGITSNSVDYVPTSELGWYIDLTIPSTTFFEGGRAVINPLVLGQIVFFVVTIPSGEVCNRDGNAYLIALNSYDGTEADFSIFDTNGDGVADSSAPVTPLSGAAVGLGSISAGGDPKLVTTNADGSIDVDDITIAAPILSGRKSWSILR